MYPIPSQITHVCMRTGVAVDGVHSLVCLDRNGKAFQIRVPDEA